MPEDMAPFLSFLEGVLGEPLGGGEPVITALTHRSYANEASMDGTGDNERLEFLGDAVLQLTASDLLMQRYPDEREGALSKYRSALVNEGSLARVAKAIDIGAYLLLGKGEEITQGRKKDSILANAFEAVVAAVYVLRGLDAARRFVAHCLKDELANVRKQARRYDYKTALQEFTQRSFKVPPLYRLVAEEGPDHAKTFDSEVLVDGRLLGRGRARSKKESEQRCAEEALSALRRELEPLEGEPGSSEEGRDFP